MLEYPFNPSLIQKKKLKIKFELKDGQNLLKKKIAILGGSTTSEIKDILELFLLNYGIEPSFYESEFGRYWQDAMFDNPDLNEFSPDLIFMHTSNRNIIAYPKIRMSAENIEEIFTQQYQHFVVMWDNLQQKYHCPIIQNNFEMPYFRLLGNKEASDIHGRVNFLSRLNLRFYEYAQTNNNFYINDINYLSAFYGLEKWSDPLFWHMYKYSLCMQAIPYLSFNIANIIKSIYGKNKKALVLDLDNTLWGGVVGDDGVDGIEIGHETPMGQVYSEFQSYLAAHKDLGIMLNVNSKNDYNNAIAGLNHPEGTLRPNDFIVIKANWENKDLNLMEICKELNIMPDSLVFVDDNSAEREIIHRQVQGVAAPDIGTAEQFITVLDRSGFFEMTNFSDDDIKRNDMYKVNIERIKMQQSFENYDDYLRSLEMRAMIRDFDSIYLQRIAQLTNKSNQFNLTTQRFSEAEIETVTKRDDYIRLYGKLSDKFGDNGVITVVMGKINGDTLHMKLWLMSCRVLKRGMEYAMLDCLVEEALKSGISKIKGYYYKTDKNAMVKDFYGKLGFELLSETEEGDSEWLLYLAGYKNKNNIIEVEK